MPGRNCVRCGLPFEPKDQVIEVLEVTHVIGADEDPAQYVITRRSEALGGLVHRDEMTCQNKSDWAAEADRHGE